MSLVLMMHIIYSDNTTDIDDIVDSFVTIIYYVLYYLMYYLIISIL